MGADGVTCFPKPHGVDKGSEGTELRTLKTKPGVFRFTETSEEVYECPWPKNCLGGSVLNGTTCITGAWGPLCFACAGGYHLAKVADGQNSMGEKDDHRCVSCSDMRHGWTGLIVIGTLAIVGAGVAYSLKDRLAQSYKDHKSRIKHTLELLTAVFVTMQAIIILKSNHTALGGQEVTAPYSRFLDMMNFMTLDAIEFVPFACVYDGGFDHFDALLLESLVPLALLAAAMALELGLHIAAEVKKQRPNSMSGRIAQRTSLQMEKAKAHPIFSNFMMLLFLVLPVIAKRVCQSFRCVDFDGGDNEEHVYLAIDMSIDCLSVRYKTLVVFGAVMIIVYPIGGPSILFVMLWRQRHRLYPPTLRTSGGGKALEAQVIDERRESGITQDAPITEFAMIYKPKFYWWEAYNMLRRLMLTCAASLFSSLGETTVFVIFVSVVTLVIEREARPHVSLFLSGFTYCMLWQILIFVLFMLLLDARITGHLGNVAISSLLMGANVLIMLVVILQAKVAHVNKLKTMASTLRLVEAAKLRRSTMATLRRATAAVKRKTGEGVEMSDRGQARSSFVNPLFKKPARASTTGALEVEGAVAVEEVEVVATSAQRAAATGSAAAAAAPADEP